MKVNHDKHHLLINSNSERDIILGDKAIESSKYEKLLGINMIIT